MSICTYAYCSNLLIGRYIYKLYVASQFYFYNGIDIDLCAAAYVHKYTLGMFVYTYVCMIVYDCIRIMCINVCTSMYAGRSLTEPLKSSLMSTNRSVTETAGLEFSDYHAPAELEADYQPPQIRIGTYVRQALICCHLCCSSNVHIYVCTYIRTRTFTNIWLHLYGLYPVMLGHLLPT